MESSLTRRPRARAKRPRPEGMTATSTPPPLASSPPPPPPPSAAAAAAAFPGASLGGRPGKARKRRTYTAKDKALVIQADAEGGRPARLRAAASIGMPVKTADNLLARFSEHQDVHTDHRSKNGGHRVKMDAFQGQLVLAWLHLNASLTLRQLLNRLNTEVLRALLKRDCVDLLEDETQDDGPLDTERYLREYPETAEAFRRLVIKSPQTVGNWLTRVFCIRKHLFAGSSLLVSNTPEMKRQRLTFAKSLRNALREDERGQESDSFLIFIDDAPFDVTDYRTPQSKLPAMMAAEASALPVSFEGAATGQSAVDRVILRMQTALAVHPSIGVLHSAAYPPSSPARVLPIGGSGSMVRDAWDGYAFLEFLDGVMANIYSRAQMLAGKRVFLVLGAAHEHGAEIKTPDLVRGLPSFPDAKEALSRVGAELRILEVPPCSAHLNLCEYYSRALRDAANERRADLHEKISRMLPVRRPEELSRILKSALADFQAAPPLLDARAGLVSLVEEVIARQGFLDVLHADLPSPGADFGREEPSES